MPFDLYRLGSTRFEHLSQALALAELGGGVQVFGAGPDGGREATFRGTAKIRDEKGPWSGYVVIQAKYKAKTDGTRLDQRWFLSELRKELDRWVSPESARGERPSYLLLFTNVSLTAVPDTGGLDQVAKLIAKYPQLGLRGHAVWHGDKVERLLEVHHGVRRAYADLILTGDVVARLHDLLEESDDKIQSAVIGYCGRAMRNDRNVALGESGDAANTPLALDQVAVDLAAQFVDSEHETMALADLVSRGDNVLRPSLRPAARERVVVLGGPGQGKSTIARLLCQIYRAALLSTEDETAVVPEVREAAIALRASLIEAALPTPTLHRIPIHIQLDAFADEISGGSDTSLLRYLTKVINHRAGQQLTDAELRRLLREWPSLIVLDGFDEVASALVRSDVVERITDFMQDVRNICREDGQATTDADVFLVCTSRSQGFDDALPLAHYDHLALSRLTADPAIRYADRLLRARYPDDEDRREEITARLRGASTEPTTARLTETPLQVTIMSLLLETASRPPRSEHGLFDNFYRVIYAREVAKRGPISELLDTHRALIDVLHARVALHLHARAEVGGEAESVLSHSDFHGEAIDLLLEEGWSEGDAPAMAKSLVDAATRRLVLIVPVGVGVGFEVRSLQEFMAAKAILDCRDREKLARLELVALSAHWRHTWLLAAGRIFVDHRSLRSELTALIDRIDQLSYTAMLVQPGARLAVDLLDDGLAVGAPEYEERLVNSALRLLDWPPDEDLHRLVAILRPRMVAEPRIQAAVERQVTRRAHDDELWRCVAMFVAWLAAPGSGSVAEWARVRAVQIVEAKAKSPADKVIPGKLVARELPSAHREANDALKQAFETAGLGTDMAQAFYSSSSPLEIVAASLFAEDRLVVTQWEEEDLGDGVISSRAVMESSALDVQSVRESAATCAIGLRPLTDWPIVALIIGALGAALSHDEVASKLLARQASNDASDEE